MMQQTPAFVDLFAGAGGLSLGLMKAGLRGLFAVEHEKNAFETLQVNLIDTERELRYDWPTWLTRGPWEIGQLIKQHEDSISSLRGSVDLLAGGPPCQGFSSAGQRKRDDPRNRLFELYVEMARLLEPSFLVFENVPWIAIEFDKEKRQRENPRKLGRPAEAFSSKIADRLADLHYKVFILQEKAADFGVPQTRPRYLILAIKESIAGSVDEAAVRQRLSTERNALLAELGLPLDRPVTVREAISDLVIEGRKRTDCVDYEGFEQIVYEGPLTDYQKLMHRGMSDAEAPNSMRLVQHRPGTIERFKKILATCRKGVRMTPAEREQFGMCKASVTPLHPDMPSHTLTSLPDDFLHYSEPRIMTVREYARLQSFPDWFAFRGKYTTGGQERKRECPRYTQVANAVPPLLAEVVGRLIIGLHRDLAATSLGSVEGAERDASANRQLVMI